MKQAYIAVCLIFSVGCLIARDVAAQSISQQSTNERQVVLDALGATNIPLSTKESWRDSGVFLSPQAEAVIFAAPEKSGQNYENYIRHNLTLKRRSVDGGVEFRPVTVSPLENKMPDGRQLFRVNLAEGWLLERRQSPLMKESNLDVDLLGQQIQPIQPSFLQRIRTIQQRMSDDPPIVIAENDEMEKKLAKSPFEIQKATDKPGRHQNVQAFATIFFDYRGIIPDEKGKDTEQTAQEKDAKKLCGAVHFSTGHLLTARHCTVGENHEAVFGDYINYKDASETHRLLRLTINKPFTTDPSLKDFDVAVLDINDLDAAAALPVVKIEIAASEGTIAKGTKLDLVRRIHDDLWRGAIGISANKQCMKESEERLNCRPGEFVHGCNTYRGVSGSPIFKRETSELVGIHVSGRNGYNCAVPLTVFASGLAQLK